jgi:hypothetical protein
MPSLPMRVPRMLPAPQTHHGFYGSANANRQRSAQQQTPLERLQSLGVDAGN